MLRSPSTDALLNSAQRGSTCANLFMRIHADGKGFLMAQSSGDQPYPVANEERAVELFRALFRALWRRAQAEAPPEG